MSFGAGRWYVALGVDIVVTDDEIGVFTTQGIGPDTQILGIDSSEMDKYKRKNFGESEEYRNGYSIIDVGVSFIKAELYGDSLTQSVANYAGISQVGGFSIPVFTFLAMTSADSKTKEPDYAITGLGYGLNIGPLPVEIHDNFSVAKPLWIFPKK